MVLHEDDRGATIYALRPSVWLDLPCFENRWQAQVTGDGQHITSSEEVLAVAHMMLAAPDLLAALKQFRTKVYNAALGSGMDDEWATVACSVADAAIAKAEGGAA
jgi:hypothetical protein